MKKFQHDNTFNVLYFIANSTPTMMTTMETISYFHHIRCAHYSFEQLLHNTYIGLLIKCLKNLFIYSNRNLRLNNPSFFYLSLVRSGSPFLCQKRLLHDDQVHRREDTQVTRLLEVHCCFEQHSVNRLSTLRRKPNKL